MKILCTLIVGTVVSNYSFSQAPSEKPVDSVNKMYVGTYTKKEGHVDGKAEGIYYVHQKVDSGNLKLVCTAASNIVNPSFVKAGKKGNFLFAVSELGPGEGENGWVYSYKIKEDGSLEELDKESSGAFAPCHLELDKSGKYLFVSNYVGGVVREFKIDNDGGLSLVQELNIENPQKSHAHSVTISGDNRNAYIADLGNDKIWIYDFDATTGTLKPSEQKFVELPKGAGPRHMVFTKNGSYAYSVNELNSSVSVFKVLKNGGLELIQNISSLPASYKGKNAPADIHLHPSGRFLYASNRFHDSIVIYAVNQDTGKLSVIDYVPIAGKTPRNFTISPYGKYLYAASQDTGNITIYTINENTGKLTPKSSVFEIKTPVCLEFVK
ncbi:lactonase family protein [Christiangramia fulva]|nr:lactonase family protein [Christiangramia fulva]